MVPKCPCWDAPLQLSCCDHVNTSAFNSIYILKNSSILYMYILLLKIYFVVWSIHIRTEFILSIWMSQSSTRDLFHAESWRVFQIWQQDANLFMWHPTDWCTHSTKSLVNFLIVGSDLINHLFYCTVRYGTAVMWYQSYQEVWVKYFLYSLLTFAVNTQTYINGDLIATPNVLHHVSCALAQPTNLLLL